MDCQVENFWVVECVGSDGVVKWREEFANLIVTVGLNKLLDSTFKTGASSPVWYVGLVQGSAAPVYAATDTMASHAGWTEITNYSQTTRPQFTPGSVSAGSVDNSGSAAAFSITASVTIAGAFLVTDNVKSGTGGTLYGEGNFSGGNRTAVSGDTVNVTVTLTAASA